MDRKRVVLLSVIFCLDEVARDTLAGAFAVYSNGKEELWVSEVYWTSQLTPTEFETFMFDLLRHEGAHAADWRGNYAPDYDAWMSADYHGQAFFSFTENCEQQ